MRHVAKKPATGAVGQANFHAILIARAPNTAFDHEMPDSIMAIVVHLHPSNEREIDAFKMQIASVNHPGLEPEAKFKDKAW